MRERQSMQQLSGHGSMTPMIDVVFLLLIYFVWTASFQIAEQLMPATFASKQAASGSEATPTEVTPAESEIVVIEMRLGEQGSIPVINGREVADWDEVRATLLAVAEVDGSTPVVIDPAPEVPYGEAIRALDLPRSLGFAKVHFAAPE